MEPLTAEEITILREMIQERLSRNISPKRLRLKREFTTNKSVRLPKELLLAATRREPNFSALVERLIFEWLGSPEELLE